jgi:LuxR family maltose regulon positive regulatory protein
VLQPQQDRVGGPGLQPGLLRQLQPVHLRGRIPQQCLQDQLNLNGQSRCHTRTLTTGEVEVVEERLLDAERRLNARAALQQGPQAPPAEPDAVEEEYRRLPAGIELYRAALAAAHGDAPGTVRHAQRALDLSPAEDHLGRAAAAGLLGLTSWGLGDLEAAHGAWSACVAGLRRAGFVADIMGCSLALADIRITQGRLGEALRTYEQALGLAQEEHASVLRGIVDMHAGMSELYRERDDLAAAGRHLLTCQELGEHNGLPQHPYRWRVALAGLEEAQGNLAGALTLLDEAERRYVSDFFPNVRPVPALKARVWIAQGRLGDALGWAREQGLSADDDLSYLREFEHITLARVLLAQRENDQASRLLAAARGPEDDGPVEQALIDPLSERELDVLRLLGTELNGPAIARELVVSLNTVRTHTKSIYAKLGVTSRGAAVRRATEVGLLPRAGDRRQP